MNDTILTSTLRSTSPFQHLHRETCEAKAQIRKYKQQENFMELVRSEHLMFKEKVNLLFVKKASKGHLNKLQDLIKEMSHKEMYESYLNHMDYVGDLPGVARVFTYLVKSGE